MHVAEALAPELPERAAQLAASGPARRAGRTAGPAGRRCARGRASPAGRARWPPAARGARARARRAACARPPARWSRRPRRAAPPRAASPRCSAGRRTAAVAGGLIVLVVGHDAAVVVRREDLGRLEVRPREACSCRSRTRRPARRARGKGRRGACSLTTPPPSPAPGRLPAPPAAAALGLSAARAVGAAGAARAAPAAPLAHEDRHLRRRAQRVIHRADGQVLDRVAVRGRDPLAEGVELGARPLEAVVARGGARRAAAPGSARCTPRSEWSRGRRAAARARRRCA